MDKGVFLNELFENIKDKVEFDSDIYALYKILISFLKIDVEEAIKKWQYLLKKYDIKKLKKDIDFEPLIKSFPTDLFQVMPLEEFYQILEHTPNNKSIYENIFNVFDNTSALYTQINFLIMNNDEENEKKAIKLIIQKLENYHKNYFDLSTFLKNIILIHLRQNSKNIDLLLEYTDIPKDIKDKSVLKTLLIDYL